MASTAYAKLFLRGLKWDSVTNATTLALTLKTAAQAQLRTVNGGLVLVGAAQNGHSTSFALPANSSGITPSAVAELCSEMLDLYDSARAILVAAGTLAPSDDVIYAAMLVRLQPVKSFRPNFEATSYA